MSMPMCRYVHGLRPSGAGVTSGYGLVLKLCACLRLLRPAIVSHLACGKLYLYFNAFHSHA